MFSQSQVCASSMTKTEKQRKNKKKKAKRLNGAPIL